MFRRGHNHRKNTPLRVPILLFSALHEVVNAEAGRSASKTRERGQASTGKRIANNSTIPWEYYEEYSKTEEASSFDDEVRESPKALFGRKN